MSDDCIRIICVLLLISFALVLPGCYDTREKAYYANIENFITEEACVENIIYSEEDNYIVLWLTGIDPLYQSSCFIIRDKNVSLAIDNGIFQYVKVGDRITYTSAPGYFGDGYFMPIVGLTVGDIVILDLEKGYRNLMESY